MENLLNRVIKSDALAREKLKEAEAYRKEQMASLPEKKEEIVSQEKQKAITVALRRNHSSLTAKTKQLDMVRERNKIAEEQMEKLYAEKCDQWVDTMFNNIIG